MTIKSEKAVLPIMMLVKTARPKVRIGCTAGKGTSTASLMGAEPWVMDFRLAPMGVMKSQAVGSPVGHIIIFLLSKLKKWFPDDTVP